MTEKELHRLRRQDLLQLLLSQGKEALALQTKLSNTSSALIQTKAGYDRLKEKLDDKDALIEKLKGRLDDKDARIRELETEMEALRLSRKIQIEESGSIAEAALKLNGVFEAAQKAAEQYLYNLQRMSDQKAEGLFQRKRGFPDLEEEFPDLEKFSEAEEFSEIDEEFSKLDEELPELDEEDGFLDFENEEEPRNADE